MQKTRLSNGSKRKRKKYTQLINIILKSSPKRRGIFPQIQTLKAQDFIEAHAHEKITVGTISEEVLMSERTFIRRFKAATGNLPTEYIQRVKVEHAKKLLEEGKENIKEISYKSGYEDLNYFRDIFKRYTGLTPIEYKKMYSFGG